MDDAISKKERRLRQRSDELWLRIQTAWLEIPLRQGAGPTGPTWEVFAERFERCFRHVSSYVARRVADRESFERIVTKVLAGNLDLLTAPCHEREEMKRLRASADRLLALRAASSPDAGTPSFGRELDVRATPLDQQE